MKIAVDFDGTIHRYAPEQKPKFGEAIPGAVEAIQTLQREGHEIIVYTAREDLDGIRAWLMACGLKLPVTNRKPRAWRYVDDRAIRFNGWANVLAELRMQQATDPECRVPAGEMTRGSRDSM